jgi:hypothetical protein
MKRRDFITFLNKKAPPYGLGKARRGQSFALTRSTGS